MERVLGRVARAAFDPANVSLRNPASGRQALLRQTLTDASIPKLEPKNDAGREGFSKGSVLCGV
jgi:hypothetical protein